MEEVRLQPGESGIYSVHAPKIDIERTRKYELEPYILPGVQIDKDENMKMASDKQFLINITNLTNGPKKLQKGLPVGKIIAREQGDGKIPTIAVNLVEDPVTEPEIKTRIIIAGDHHLNQARVEVRKALEQHAQLEIFCPENGEMNRVLDELNHAAPSRDTKTIIVVIAGNEDFNRRYCLQSHSAIANDLPLGRIRELTQEFHVAYTTLLPRYDINRLNEKIALVNADIIGQAYARENTHQDQPVNRKSTKNSFQGKRNRSEQQGSRNTSKHNRKPRQEHNRGQNGIRNRECH